jgi:hypothetical protein
MLGGASLGVGIAMAQQLARGAMMSPAGVPPAAAPTPSTSHPAPSGKLVSCPSCATQVAAGKFCADCGSALLPVKRVCASCGIEGAPNARFCAECGTAFAQPA